jgi:hypothetical protein
MNRVLNHYGYPVGERRQRPFWLVPAVLTGLVVTGWLAKRFGLMPPAWLMILVVLGLIVAASVWATQPADVGLGRHIAALIGQAVLDVLRTVLRAVVAALVALALLAAGWSFAAPRIQAQVGHWRDAAVGSATSAVHDAVPVPHLPSVRLPWTEATK